MKELSIEEKAERYDEALKWMENVYPTLSHEQQMEAEAFFPMFKENEDEKIRKGLINFFSEPGRKEYILNGGFTINDIIAWLRKQGEQKTKEETQSHYPQRFMVDDTIKYNGTEYKITSIESNGYRVYPLTYDEDAASLISFGASATLVEQKPADKVEPEFHNGDWITNGEEIGQVIEWNHPDCIGYKTNYGTEKAFNKKDISKWHKWTIQEAKDGDVIAIDPWSDYPSSFVTIYKKQNGEDFDSHCFVGFDGKFYKGENEHSTEGIHPATKEQRNLLFQKMKEAGYTFDFEKKELKKIEQKPAGSGDIKGVLLAHDEILNNLLGRYKTSVTFKTLIVNLQNWWNNTKRHLLSFNIEQKPTEWNEEDIMRIDNIIAIIEGKGYPDYVRWLESLKDRVSPQPKQEWSKEDEEMLLSAIEYVCSFSAYRNSVVDWLKSLKTRVQPQPNPKWSEEDGEILDDIIVDIEVLKEQDKTKDGKASYQKEIDWLKSLSYKTGSQKYWKPSDEHYELEEFAKIVRANLIGINKDVQKLFEAKYLQLTGNKMYGGFKD